MEKKHIRIESLRDMDRFEKLALLLLRMTFVELEQQQKKSTKIYTSINLTQSIFFEKAEKVFEFPKSLFFLRSFFASRFYFPSRKI